MAETTTAPKTTEATPETGKPGRKRLPEVDKVFDTKEACDKGSQVAIDKGHTYDTRKFKVQSADGKSTKFVLAYSPANAVSQVWEAMGVKCEEIDPSSRAPFQASPATLASKMGALSDQEKLEAFLALGMSEKDAKALIAKAKQPSK